MKSGKVEKDAKLAVEGSPSGKGTLDNYLRTSQEDNQTTKPSQRAYDLLAKLEPVKRNLSLEINKFTKDESKQPLLSALVQPPDFEVFKIIQKVTSQVSSEGGCDSRVNDCSVSAHVKENSELKQFANDFLSLYCRYCLFLKKILISSWYKLLLSCFYG